VTQLLLSHRIPKKPFQLRDFPCALPLRRERRLFKAPNKGKPRKASGLFVAPQNMDRAKGVMM
jgi:hypothetical protein